MLPMPTVVGKKSSFELNHLVDNFASNRRKRWDVRSVQQYLSPPSGPRPCKPLTSAHPISLHPPVSALRLPWLHLAVRNEQLPEGFLLTQNLMCIQ